MIPARELAAYVSLAAVLALLWSCGSPNGYSRRTHWQWSVQDGDGYGGLGGLSQPEFDAQKLPDFGRYRMLRMLDGDEFPLDSPGRRVIFVGDIHGMFNPLNQLLDKIGYNPKDDLLIHTGDFLAKGLHRQSMATLAYMTAHNITGVRGNHDQQVIEWRGWINWICSSRDGCDWLKRTEHRWKVKQRQGSSSLRSRSHKPIEADLDDDDELEEFLQDQKAKAPSRDRRWWKLVPADWKFLGGQYRIAREMSKEQYDYLLQLPVALYVPHAHTFVAHAGILPSDPRYPYYDAERQPLARIPDVFHMGDECHDALRCTMYLRRAQEMSILTDVPQNTDPWTLLNVRGIKNGKVYRDYKGVYWAKLWNKQMGRCIGFAEGLAHAFDGDEDAEKKKPKNVALPCYPATVVYGHSASRGLSPKRWSIGLDSGCVYGRKLTAIVVGEPIRGSGKDRVEVYDEDVDDGEREDEDSDGEDAGDDREDDYSDDIGRRSNANRWRRRKHKKKGDGDIVPFGDHYKAKIVSVKCRQP